MVDKIKRSYEWIFCAGIGLLNFIFLAFPWFAAFSKSPIYNFSQGGNAYDWFDILKEADQLEGKFGAIMCGIFAIIILIFGILMLAYGVLGMLKEFGVFAKFPDKFGKMETKKLATLLLYVYAGLIVLLFIFDIIFTASNTEKVQGYSAGFRLSAGPFLTIIFVGGAIAGLIILKKKLPAGEGAQVSYVCSKCGAKASAKDKFCNDCGGEIKKVEKVKQNYVCSKCGAKASEKDKFCNDCGGEIVVQKVVQYVCSKCGEKAEKGDKFCNSCGGAIIEKGDQDETAKPTADAKKADEPQKEEQEQKAE